MKRLFTILFFFIGFSAFSQVPLQDYTPRKFAQIQVVRLGIPSDTLKPPVNLRDSVWLAGKDSVLYMWSPSLRRYVKAAGGGGTGSAVFGGIAGNINNQTDLVNKFSQYQPLVAQGEDYEYFNGKFTRRSFSADVRSYGRQYFLPVDSSLDASRINHLTENVRTAISVIGPGASYNPSTGVLFIDTARGGGSAAPNISAQRLYGRYAGTTGPGQEIKTGRNGVISNDTLNFIDVTYSAKNIGITAVSGDKTAALNSEALSSLRKTILFDDNVPLLISGTYNGQGKSHEFKNGAKFTSTSSATVTNIIIGGDHTALIFDTTVKVVAPLNTVIYATDFGFIPGASSIQNTKALYLIGQTINSNSGGYTLELSRGAYAAGRQQFTNGANGYMFRPDTLLAVYGCTKPVIIHGNGAVIKLIDGLRYGTFNSSGNPVTHPLPYGNASNDAAAIGYVFNLHDNASITITGLTIDGNLPNLSIGGPFGDTGNQLTAIGINDENNAFVSMDDVKCINNGLDGIWCHDFLTQRGLTPRPHTYRNCIFTGNGRNDISWTAGNSLTLTNCQMTRAGKTVNTGTGTVFFSAPASGFDNEPEGGAITEGGLVDNCLFSDNQYAAYTSDGQTAAYALGVTFKNSTIIGTTNYSLFARCKKQVFDNCTIIGAMTGVYNAASFSDPDRTIFNNCTFSFDTLKSPTHQVYLTYMDFGIGNYAEFNGGTFDGGQGGNNPYSAFQTMKYSGVTFKQTTTTTSFTQGVFDGTNTFIGYHNDFGSSSTFLGDVYVDGVLLPQAKRFWRRENGTASYLETGNSSYENRNQIINSNTSNGARTVIAEVLTDANRTTAVTRTAIEAVAAASGIASKLDFYINSGSAYNKTATLEANGGFTLPYLTRRSNATDKMLVRDTVTGSFYYTDIPSGGSAFTLSTTGTSGPATYTSGVLNIPNYSATSLAVVSDADYTIASGVTDVVVSNQTAARTITLPAASSNANRKITIKNGGAGAYVLNLSTTIKENTTTTNSSIGQGLWVTIVSDGTDWWIVASK